MPVCVVGQGIEGFTEWILDVKVTVQKLLSDRKLLIESSEPHKTRELEFEEKLSNELTRLITTLQSLNPKTEDCSKKFYNDFMRCFGVITEQREEFVEQSSFDLREYDPGVTWFQKIVNLTGHCIGKRKNS